MNIFKVALPFVVSFSSLADAALYDRGNGMIYDSGLNITWLQDANYAKKSNYDVDGQMVWEDAVAWADNLVYGGFSDWRLSSSALVNNYSYSNDGSTDLGYGNSRSEIGHLFLELGNKGYYDASGLEQPGYGMLNTSFIDAGTGQSKSFFNVDITDDLAYWEGVSRNSNGYIFETSLGWHGSPGQNSLQFFAWAVRDGDVAAVPVPAAAWLFGSALIIVGAARNRQKNNSIWPGIIGVRVPDLSCEIECF